MLNLTQFALGSRIPNVSVWAGAHRLVVGHPAVGGRRARVPVGARVQAEAVLAGCVVGAVAVAATPSSDWCVGDQSDWQEFES